MGSISLKLTFFELLVHASPINSTHNPKPSKPLSVQVSGIQPLPSPVLSPCKTPHPRSFASLHHQQNIDPEPLASSDPDGPGNEDDANNDFKLIDFNEVCSRYLLRASHNNLSPRARESTNLPSL
jgi:hypothetical protein